MNIHNVNYCLLFPSGDHVLHVISGCDGNFKSDLASNMVIDATLEQWLFLKPSGKPPIPKKTPAENTTFSQNLQ